MNDIYEVKVRKPCITSVKPFDAWNDIIKQMSILLLAMCGIRSQFGKEKANRKLKRLERYWAKRIGNPYVVERLNVCLLPIISSTEKGWKYCFLIFAFGEFTMRTANDMRPCCSVNTSTISLFSPNLNAWSTIAFVFINIDDKVTWKRWKNNPIWKIFQEKFGWFEN